MQNTFIITPVRPDLIERCLETLYKHTVPNFYVYLIDQTPKGLNSELLRNKYKNLMYIRTPRTMTHHAGNLGFAKVANLGISLVETPYFTLCNDDVEFVNRKWWQGVMDTFTKVEASTPDRPAVMVNPASIKLPDWSVGLPKGEHHYILPYKEKYTEDDYTDLVEKEHYINEHLTLMPGSVIDGVVMYESVFDTRKFLEVGMLPEQHYPGMGEDYWWGARANMFGYRSVGTTLSWVFHHWSKSFESLQAQEEIKETLDTNLIWNDNNADWGENFDHWGMKCTQCEERMRTKDGITAICPNHPQEVYKMPEARTTPL